MDLVHERLDRRGDWQRSFFAPEVQRAYRLGQRDGRKGVARDRLRDGSWQSSPGVVSAYWLGFHSRWKAVATPLPDGVRDLTALAQHLHREAAWTAAGAVHNEDGGPADVEALLALTGAMSLEQAARLVDQLIVGPESEDQVIWADVSDDDEQPESKDGMTMTLAANGEGVRIRISAGEHLRAERVVSTWWEAHTVLGNFIHTLSATSDEPPAAD